MPKNLDFLNEPCHSCGTAGWERVQRIGFLQKKVLPLFHLYPWRCPICNKHRYLKLRADPRIKHFENSREHPLVQRHIVTHSRKQTSTNSDTEA